MDKVMWAYQARQSRTWYSSRPAVFLAPMAGGAVAGVIYRLLLGSGAEPVAAEAQDVADVTLA